MSGCQDNCPEWKSVLNSTSHGPTTNNPKTITRSMGSELACGIFKGSALFICHGAKSAWLLWKRYSPLLHTGFLVRNMPLTLKLVIDGALFGRGQRSLYVPLKSKVRKDQKRRFYIADPVFELTSSSSYTVMLKKSPVKTYTSTQSYIVQNPQNNTMVHCIESLIHCTESSVTFGFTKI